MESFKAWTVAFSLVFIAVAALVRLFSPKFPKRFRARVVYVYDGDTICVRHRFRKLRIRLLGIDAPEFEQEYGQESQQYLQSLVLHKKVEISAIGVDIYGRYLGKVVYGDRDAGCDLLEAGLAWPYFRFFGNLSTEDRKRYRGVSRQAYRYRRGLWRQKQPVAPWVWRRNHRSLWSRFLIWIRRFLHWLAGY